ncbi:hypothetical protein OESDEN_14784 [Oesophagostomum dentatum]|uniref:Uncharacterized protein n=1 Tax=Oesophagostomum dentatum TaxID=61180 RepID=A0A0B1SJH0_OESDE|nr:hypothetical protein OESDEN_14784 [Oesophagostomum dentatum]
MFVGYVLNWKDLRLKWDPSGFDNIKELVINRELVWRADLVPYDSHSVYETRDEGTQHIYISFTGLVELFVSSVVSFACPIDGHGEWSVDGVTAEVCLWMPTVEDYNFDVATFTFRLRRNSIYYVIMIIIPSFVLTFLCILGLFWSNFDQGDYLEKLGLGFTAILAMCMVLEIAENSVPKTKQLPSLCTYIMVNLILITLAISVVVMASKSCSMKALGSLNTNKWLRHFAVKPCTRFRVLCLILFALGSIVNLLVLLTNV